MCLCYAQFLSCAQLFATAWLWPARLLCSCRFSREEYWSGLPCLSPRDLPNPGVKPRSLALQDVSLQSGPPVKPKNTGMGSLSHLQRIFPTQESNRGLQHCRWILYQVSYQGSPNQLYVYIFSLPLRFSCHPPHPLPSHLSRSPQSTKLSSLHYAIGSQQLSVLPMAVTYQPQAPNSRPHVHSLHLCLYFCPADMLI